ncbi:toll/interleukin-1 receptor domain-containing protein [Mucilaginibacter sp. ZT4R22]|uniref:Toll/interleukin-1 receptor domain-containing protein n=1 Tax=Mucilaginibacter pankratovii TaxID=2772110 RepID=A0ABR7WVU5_9SPHI|nr:toll/interleukin-1 receptor domain-containing protein [Mucilaginibacter pankratovii]MBD1365387.1 toll/interleukin-1 receptor domain-containing protein [Mucilaginibacter pankratovii]
MSIFNKVFISYAKEDQRYALAFYDHFENLGYEPWLDKRKLLPGSNWDLEIKRALKNSDFIILLLSSTSVSKRGYVQREFKLALQYWETKLDDDIYIIPVLLDDCVVPESLGRFQWVRYDEAFPAVIQAIERQQQTQQVHYDLSPEPVNANDDIKGHDFTTYDLTLISLLSQGFMQKGITAVLKEKELGPAGLSSVEKRLALIREALAFSKNEQLVAYCKDKGLI